jgi:hypothetical protein
MLEEANWKLDGIHRTTKPDFKSTVPPTNKQTGYGAWEDLFNAYGQSRHRYRDPFRDGYESWKEAWYDEPKVNKEPPNEPDWTKAKWTYNAMKDMVRCPKCKSIYPLTNVRANAYFKCNCGQPWNGAVEG